MMQRDDDVGKIAGPAPVVMSKALRLFVAQLVRVTRGRRDLHGAKTVTGSHLKGAVGMVPEAFAFRERRGVGGGSAAGRPSWRRFEAELKAREEDGGKAAVKRGRSEEGEVKILGVWAISLVGLWTRNWNRG